MQTTQAPQMATNTNCGNPLHETWQTVPANNWQEGPGGGVWGVRCDCVAMV